MADERGEMLNLSIRTLVYRNRIKHGSRIKHNLVNFQYVIPTAS